MDNLTHTLIGALVGETAALSSAADPRGLSPDMRRTLLVGSAAVGSNLPDSDLLYSFFGANVNYLLHHRGHTHTLVGALLLAALAYALLRWWLGRRGLVVSAADRAWIAGTLAFTALLHIGMDFMNNYGVHPFWPIDSRWWYGDSVFIIEPLLWAACAPLALLFKARWARALVALLLLTGLGLVFFTGLVPTMIGLMFTALVGLMLLVPRIVRPQVALAIGVSFWLGVTALFAASATVAADRVVRAARDRPQAQLLDHVLTPMPANPLCWEAILVQADGDDVSLRRAMVALVPDWLSADRCGTRSFELKTTAPLTGPQGAGGPALKWYGEIRTSSTLLASLNARDCIAAAALRFMRTPYVARVDGRTILGDLRYDREPGLGFAEVIVGEDQPSCPAFVPSWTPPREDLLGHGKH